MKKPEILIIGGGLAGLTASIHLAQAGFKVSVFEKGKYPRHKVCGEYLSNEVKPYLKSLGVNLLELRPQKIEQLLFTTESGKSLREKLPMGGMGISRFALDYFLYQKAQENGVKIYGERVVSLTFENEIFRLQTAEKNKFQAKIVLAAYGKRSNLDKVLKRNFIQQKSKWLAVKAHYQHAAFPENLVALHNFKGGYCGLSKTETSAVNVCYLATYQSFKPFKNPKNFQDEVLMKNPVLEEFFDQSEPFSDAPLSIAQISFAPKKAVEGHVLMLGDAAGLIHPLCGNGMAMAIHSAKIASETIIGECTGINLRRKELEGTYKKNWDIHFKKRIQMGRLLQKIVLNPSLSKLSQHAMHVFPGLLPAVISKTHGEKLI